MTVTGIMNRPPRPKHSQKCHFERRCPGSAEAAKFESQCHRSVCINKYAPEHDPDALVVPLGADTFYKMVRPAFSDKCSEADVYAIMKRANFVVCTKKRIYVRKWSEDKVSVPFISYPPGKNDFLAPEAYKRFGEYKKGIEVFRPCFWNDMD